MKLENAWLKLLAVSEKLSLDRADAPKVHKREIQVIHSTKRLNRFWMMSLGRKELSAGF